MTLKARLWSGCLALATATLVLGLFAVLPAAVFAAPPAERPASHAVAHAAALVIEEGAHGIEGQERREPRPVTRAASAVLASGAPDAAIGKMAAELRR